jgi:hypothetical protein
MKLKLREAVRLSFVLKQLRKNRFMTVRDLQFKTTVFFDETLVSSFITQISCNWFPL